jgi:homoserine kinase
LIKIKVFAPATVANLACGFDVMGLAIDQPGDEVIVELNDSGKLRIVKITGDDGKLSLDPKKNTVTVSILNMLKKMGREVGADITLNKKMPLGSGLGSSAASSVAGVFAMNELLGKPFSRKELVPFAMEGERIACGSAHADNVAPCMLGGIVLIRSYEPLDIISLPVPKNLYLALVHPHVEVMTRDSRAVMPKKIDLKTGISQWANTAALVAGLFTSDYALIGRSVVDHVAEPERAGLLPHFTGLKKLVLQSGALACSISGSGPSVFALCDNKNKAVSIAATMKKFYDRKKINSETFVSKINNEGVKIIN